MEKIPLYLEANQPMPAKLKALWVKALRSDRFEQGQSSLGMGLRRRCCLGVLVQCMVEAKVAPELVNLPTDELASIYIRGDIVGVIPLAWRNGLGLEAPVGKEDLVLDVQPDKYSEPLESESAHDFLINRNDASEGKRWSFSKIADWVEANL